MILDSTNVIMNLDNLFKNDRDGLNRSVFRICSTITSNYSNISELQLERLFYIKNNRFR